MTRSFDALPAAEAMANTGGNEIKLEYTANYNLSGSTNVDEVKAILEEHDSTLRGRLEDMLSDIDADRRRRSYD